MMAAHRCSMKFVKFFTKGGKKWALYRCTCGNSHEEKVGDLFGQEA
jgi:hypothetical protein